MVSFLLTFCPWLVLADPPPLSGTLTSTVLDTRRSIIPVSLRWEGSNPSNTEVKFQIATSNNANGPWTYRGPDGNSSSYYTGVPGTYLKISSQYHKYQRYLRYKTTLTRPNASVTPVLDTVTIYYTH